MSTNQSSATFGHYSSFLHCHRPTFSPHFSFLLLQRVSSRDRPLRIAITFIVILSGFSFYYLCSPSMAPESFSLSMYTTNDPVTALHSSCRQVVMPAALPVSSLLSSSRRMIFQQGSLSLKSEATRVPARLKCRWCAAVATGLTGAGSGTVSEKVHFSQ